MKKTKIFVLTCIIFLLMVGISYGATSEYDIKMEIEKEKYVTGETIQIPVIVENINMEHGIVALSTVLSYDETILEEPAILNSSNWTTPIMVEDLIQTTTTTMQPTKENQKVMILSFKIKEDAKPGQTEISLLNFEASDGENTIENEDTSIKIDVKNKKEEMADVLLDNQWMFKRNMIISLIIGIVTIIIILLIAFYYIQHREKEEVKNILYEEVKGIKVENDKQEEEKSE